MRLKQIFMGGAALALLAMTVPGAHAGPRFDWDRFPFIFDDGGYDDDEYVYVAPAPRKRKRLRQRHRPRPQYDQYEQEKYLRDEEDEASQYGLFEMDVPNDGLDEPPPRRRLDKARKKPRKIEEKAEDAPPPVRVKPPAKRKKPAVAAAKVAAPKAMVKPKPKPPIALANSEDGGSGGAVSCGDATKIVSDYGFGAVEAADCKGEEYVFNAERAGKAYAIKMSAASGELIEVVKQPQAE